MPAPADVVVVVETSFRVPGLGVLALPAEPSPAWLGAYPLHTALALSWVAPGRPPTPLTGTVEELARADQPPRRALLLDFDPGEPLAAGSLLHVSTGKIADELM